MNWCSGSSLVFVDGNSLSLCGLQTALLAVSGLYLVGFIYYYITLYSKFVNKFHRIDNYTNRIYITVLSCSISLCCTTALSAINQNVNLALITSTAVQSLAWLVCSYNIYLDVWFIPLWPSWIVKLFLAVEVIMLLISAAVIYNSNQTTLELLLGTLSFLIAVLLLIISIFKDTWRNIEDVSKCNAERMVYSSTVMNQSGLPLLSNDDDDNSSQQRDSFLFPERQSSRSNSWNFNVFGIKSRDSLKNPYEAVTSNKPKNRDYFGIFRTRKDSEGPWNDIERFRDDDSFSSPSKNFGSSNVVSQPLVKSVLERHLESSPVKGSLKSSDRKSSTSSGPNRLSFTDGSNSLGRVSTTHSSYSDHSGISDTPPQMQKSGALQRALDMQRSRLHASKQSTSQRINSTSQSKSISVDSSGGTGIFNIVASENEFYITIQRWVLRQQVQSSNTVTDDHNHTNPFIVDDALDNAPQMVRVTSVDGKHTSDILQESGNNFETGSLTPDRTDSPAPHNSRNSSNYSINSVPSILEFEICLHRGQENIHQGATSESEWLMSGADSQGGEDATSGRLRVDKRVGTGLWTLWKTTNDLFSLHSALLSAFGDAAPRRPKLKCVTILSGRVSNHDMATDMRTITTFLNAVLRESNYEQNSAVRAFFGLNQLDSPSSQSLSALSQAPVGSFVRGTSEESAVSTVNATGNPTQAIQPASNKEEDASNISMEGRGIATTNQQDKWRKLYVNMRVKIKPHEIGVRCYLFEGVVSGAEVAAWLIRPSDSSKSSYQHARDRVEACALGQELLNCGLLVAVGCGYEGDEEDGGIAIAESGVSNEEITNSDASLAIVNAQIKKRFLDRYGYVYRFRETSATAKSTGSWILFGAVVKVSIPVWYSADGDDDGEVTRETVSLAVKSNGLITAKSVDASPDPKSSKGHIEYLVNVSHGGDDWQTCKRYRQFEQLSRLLAKEGVRPEVALPSKSFSQVLGRVTTESVVESRRQGLELFLQSLVEAVLQTRNEKALELTAQFLDDDFGKLRFP